MSCRLYIGNLPSDIQERELEDMFYKFGRILRIEIKRVARPPLYAFVTFANSVDAKDAQQSRNGIDFDGKRLRVELSKERDDRSTTRHPGLGVGMFQPRVHKTYQVRVSGLSNKISWQDLKDFGRGISNGKKEGHLRIVHSDVYHNNGTGILEYETRQDAIRAVTELNQTVIVNPYDSTCVVTLVLGFEDDGNEREDGERRRRSGGGSGGSGGSRRRDDDRHSRRRHDSRSRSRSRDHQRDRATSSNTSLNSTTTHSSSSSSSLVSSDVASSSSNENVVPAGAAVEVGQDPVYAGTAIVYTTHVVNGQVMYGDGYDAMSYIEIRKLCKKKGLRNQGKKIDLIKWLRGYNVAVAEDATNWSEGKGGY